MVLRGRTAHGGTQLLFVRLRRGARRGGDHHSGGRGHGGAGLRDPFRGLLLQGPERGVSLFPDEEQGRGGKPPPLCGDRGFKGGA